MGLLDKGSKAKRSEPKGRKKAKKPSQQAQPDAKDKSDGKDQGDMIETILDKIYYRIKKYGRINVKKISKEYKIDKARVEYYAKILHEQAMIALEYPPVGEAVLSTEQADEKKPKLTKKMRLALFTLVMVLIASGAVVILIR
mgnify:CR=1 FL=1